MEGTAGYRREKRSGHDAADDVAESRLLVGLVVHCELGRGEKARLQSVEKTVEVVLLEDTRFMRWNRIRRFAESGVGSHNVVNGTQIGRANVSS